MDSLMIIFDVIKFQLHIGCFFMVQLQFKIDQILHGGKKVVRNGFRASK